MGSEYYSVLECHLRSLSAGWERMVGRSAAYCAAALDVVADREEVEAVAVVVDAAAAAAAAKVQAADVPFEAEEHLQAQSSPPKVSGLPVSLAAA